MKKTLIITGVVLAAIVFIAYTWFQQQTPTGKVQEKMYDVILENMLSHAVPELSVPELAAQINQYTILDSRAEAEYTISHLPNAHWISDDKFLQLQRVKELPKDKPVVVYCSVGMRSEQAAIRLKEAGFSNVSNLYGGIFEWINQSQPLVNNQDEPTNTVHGYSPVWAKWIRNGEVRYDK